MSKLFQISILILVLVGNIFAAGKITGFVTDAETGDPLAGAHVMIEGTNWMTIADNEGGFRFNDIPSGEFQISASHLGYEVARQKIILRSEVSEVINLKLKSGGINLPEVTVYFPVSEALIYTSEEIRNSSADNLATFLNSQGNINILDGGGAKEATISIRGAKPEQVAVYLDGHRLNDPRTGSIDLKTIPISSLDKIIVHQNPDLTMGSSSPGGSIELRSADNFSNSTEFTSGSFGMRKFGVILGKEYKNRTISTNFNRTTSDGDFKYKDPDTGIEETRINDDFRGDNLYVKYSQNLSGAGNFSLSFHHLNSKRGAPGGVQNPDTLDRINTNLDGLAFNYQISGSKWRNETRASYFSTSIENIDFYSWSGTVIDFSSKHSAVAVETDSKFTRRDSLGFFTTGVSYRLDQVESSSFESEVTRRDVGIYFQRNVQVFNSSLTGTIRGDDYGVFGTFLASSFNLRYTPNILNRAISFNSSWSRDLNLPTFNQLFWAENVFAAPNPDLLPERMQSWSLGLEMNTKLFAGRITYYQRDFEDMIVWRETITQSGKKWKPVNLDAAQINGFEIFGRISYGRIILNCFVGLSDPLNKNDDYYGNYLTFRPRIQTSESIILNLKKFEPSISHRYASRRYTLESNTKWEDPYSIFDTSITYSFKLLKLRNKITFRTDNIFDDAYSIINESPMPGRTYSINYTINLK